LLRTEELRTEEWTRRRRPSTIGAMVRLGRVDEQASGGDQEAASEGRRPYSAPRILSREPLESVAAVCAPAPAKSNPGVCPQGPISS
jgi:hypothetical protein